jgi:hypothetical protein
LEPTIEIVKEKELEKSKECYKKALKFSAELEDESGEETY